MIELINAALDYQQAFENLQKITYNHCKYAETAYTEGRSRDDIYRYFQELSMIISGTDLMVNLDHKVTIAVEHRHFAQYARKNAAEAARQSRRRGKAISTDTEGKLQQLQFPVREGSKSDSSPHSLIKRNHLMGRSISDMADRELSANRSASPATSPAVHYQSPPSQYQSSISSDIYEAAALRQISKAASAKIQAEYTPQQLETAKQEAEADDQIESGEFSDMLQQQSDDMLHGLTSQPVSQFAAEALPHQPPANSAELDLLVERELARQRAIEAYRQTDSPQQSASQGPGTDDE